MKQIKKFIIGIRPAAKMFRISTVAGLLIDSILAERGSKYLEDKYYSEIASNKEQDFYRLRNDELGNILKIDLTNIIFIKDYYDISKKFSFNKVISEFAHVWNTLNNIIDLKDIRRIGIAAEHQIETGQANVNKNLLKALTSVMDLNHPAKFFLRYENRYPTIEGFAPDIDKSDFINVIYDYYDGERDVDHPNKNSFNANIDVQRYYSPLLKSNVIHEVKKLNKTFVTEKNKFDNFLKEKRLVV